MPADGTSKLTNLQVSVCRIASPACVMSAYRSPWVREKIHPSASYSSPPAAMLAPPTAGFKLKLTGNLPSSSNRPFFKRAVVFGACERVNECGTHVFPTPCSHLEQSWGPQPPQTPTGGKLRGGIFRETPVIATHMKRAQSVRVRRRGATGKMKNDAGPKLTIPPRLVTAQS